MSDLKTIPPIPVFVFDRVCVFLRDMCVWNSNAKRFQILRVNRSQEKPLHAMVNGCGCFYRRHAANNDVELGDKTNRLARGWPFWSLVTQEDMVNKNTLYLNFR